MQNEDNIRPQIGRKRKKKSSNSGAPTTNPYWSAIVLKNPNQNAKGSQGQTSAATQKFTNKNPPKTSQLVAVNVDPTAGRTLTAVPLDVPSNPKWEPKAPIIPNPRAQTPMVRAPLISNPGARPQVTILSGIKPKVPQVSIPVVVGPHVPLLIPPGMRPQVPVPFIAIPPGQRLQTPLNVPDSKPKAAPYQKPAIRPAIPGLSIMDESTKNMSSQMKKLTKFLKTQVKEIQTKKQGQLDTKQSESKSMQDMTKLSSTKTNPPKPSASRGNLRPVLMSLEPNPSAKPQNPTSASVRMPMNMTPSSNTATDAATKMNKKGGPIHHSMYLTNNYSPQYPKGVPRSFLEAQMKITDEPSNMPIWPTESLKQPSRKPTQMFVQTDDQQDIVQQPYSPSDVYDELSVAENNSQDGNDDPESPDQAQTGQKRLSAFHRLGPVSQPKKPKLTINLLFNKDQPVREVIDETEENTEKYTPVHIRPDILTSTDPVVMKYLMLWPWKKHMPARKSVTARNSKTVMMLEQEQMEEFYEKNNAFIQIAVKGYPKSWDKEEVLDAVLELVKGKSFIPCFIEFTEQECKFFVLRSRSALTSIHKSGFVVRKGAEELHITISTTDVSLNHLDFIPRIILRKILASAHNGENELDLSGFTLAPDLSHFIYFPLSRVMNQTELTQMQSSVGWDYLTELDLSHNKLTTINGFDLPATTPKLKRLNLSNNYIDKLTSLLTIRALPLSAIWLDRNPLCNDYIDPEYYIKVIRMIFPCVMEIDGEKVTLRGDMPPIRRNYSPPDAVEVVNKFLDVYFPLMDSNPDQRSLVHNLYDEDATLTVTYSMVLRHNPLYRSFRNLFLRSRELMDGNMDSITSSSSIIKLINKYPEFQHDPVTFTTDVLHHNDDCTILRVAGVVKLTAETLAEDEYVVSFVRTFVLRSLDGGEYKIQNEMLYWDKLTESVAKTAFRMTTLRTKSIGLKLDSAPDEELKDGLVKIFMKLTSLDEKASEKCLQEKDWHFKNALEHFVKLLKLDDIATLTGTLI